MAIPWGATHLVLGVTARLEVRRSHARDVAARHVGEVPQDLAHPDHLSDPLLVALVLEALLERDGLGADLVAVVRQLLDHVVVAVLVGDEEGSPDGAAVGVLAALAEDLLVVLDVVDVDGAVEGEQDHLGGVLGVESAGDDGAIARAEAVRQLTFGGVALGG